MKRPSPLVVWLSLCAYFWAALGVAEAAQIDAVVAGHAQQSIMIDASVADELLVHHLGHRDGHEPHASACVQSTDACAVDADHVIKLGDDHTLSGPLAKSAAAATLTALAACVGAMVCAWAPRAQLLPAPSIPVSRNSSTASVKLARLRI